MMSNQYPFEIAALVGNDSPELVILPPGAQIYPSIHEELWEIIEALAKEDYRCDWCLDAPIRYSISRDANEEAFHRFPHSPDCIVTKARALVERRNEQPKIIGEK